MAILGGKFSPVDNGDPFGWIHAGAGATCLPISVQGTPRICSSSTAVLPRPGAGLHGTVSLDGILDGYPMLDECEGVKVLLEV